MAKTKSQSHPPQQKKKSPLAFVAVAAVLAAVAVFAFTRGNAPEENTKSGVSSTAQKPVDTTSESNSSSDNKQQKQQQPKAQEAGFRMPPYFEDPDSAGTLGPTLDPETVEPYAKAGYLVAKQKSRLLAQLPCFCYCDRFGHSSLQTCFQTNHASQCEVCLSEAVEADQMDRQGMTPADIRAAIVEKHHPRSHDHS